MLYILPVAGFVLLVGWILRRQILKRRVWLGWLMIVLIFMLFTASSILLAEYNVATGTRTFPYQEEAATFGFVGYMEVEIQDPEIVGASFLLSYGNRANTANGFGSLELEYEDGIRYIPMEFNQSGVLIGSKEALPYSQEIYATLSEHRDSPLLLTGKSISYSAIQELLRTNLPMSNDLLIPGYIQYYLIRFHLITGFLILFYIFVWMRIRRREKRNLNPIRIQDL
jgi:4-amino-4-deoxy-L-arabinose transferase-like glycosyltransferase